MKQRANFIHIDERLTSSRMKWAVWGGFLWVILGLLGLLNLPLSYRLLLGILAVLCVILNYFIRPQLMAISTVVLHPVAIAKNLKRADITLSKPLPLDGIEWQLAIKITNFPNTPNQLWQGYLLSVTDAGKMLILKVCVIEPHVQQLTLNLWQDQCTYDTWRQLKTVSHLIKE